MTTFVRTSADKVKIGGGLFASCNCSAYSDALKSRQVIQTRQNGHREL